VPSALFHQKIRERERERELFIFSSSCSDHKKLLYEMSSSLSSSSSYHGLEHALSAKNNRRRGSSHFSRSGTLFFSAFIVAFSFGVLCCLFSFALLHQKHLVPRYTNNRNRNAARTVALRRLSKEHPESASKKKGVSAKDICLFAPSTLDRLKPVLPRLAQTWAGTACIAVLASEEEVRKEIFDASTHREFTRERLTVIAVEPLPEYESRFPVNALRNLAMWGCRKQNATYVVLHDVDFEIFPNAPSKELLEEIEEVLTPNAKHGLVLPSFTADDRYLRRVETFRKEHDFSPESLDALNSFNRKEKLIELIKEHGIVESFREKYWPVAHAATNVSKWLSIAAEKKKDGEERRPYPVGANHRRSRHPYYYEPWIIIRGDIDDMPAFDESFVTYGFNKISWIHELAADGYKLFVSLSSWMVHTNTHLNRGSQTSGEMLQRCKYTANTGKDFRISRIGHSCIPRFLKRLDCAYHFGLDRVQWPTSNDTVPELYLMDTMRNESRIACFGGCVTDQEPVPKTPKLAVLQDGQVTKRVVEKPARRRREACERLHVSSSATWTL
jgi:hypothetical protein